MMQNLGTPPYANRGVERTDQSGLRACVDWLQATFKKSPGDKEIFDLLGLDFNDFDLIDDRGGYGYKMHYRYGNISLYVDPVKQGDLSAHLEITGQGCRQFEQLSRYDWSSVLGLVLMFDVNIPRLDLAIDDFDGYFSLETIKSKVRRGHVKSRFREAVVMDKHNLSDGSNKGQTVYFGSPKSDIQVRMYDKKQERTNAGHEVTADTWVRTEMQLRDDNAKLASLIISRSVADDLGQHIKGILKNNINFLVENKKDKNKRRWKVCKFWEKYLGDVERLPLSQVAPDKTIQRAHTWLRNSVSPSFKTVFEARDYDLTVIIDLLEKGDKKQSKKHEQMLDSYYIENGIDKFDEGRERNRLEVLQALKDLKRKMYKKSQSPGEKRD